MVLTDNGIYEHWNVVTVRERENVNCALRLKLDS